MDVAGKNIVLTGAASGIGLAVMELLAGHPVQILAVDMNGAALDAACLKLNTTGLPPYPGTQATVTPYVCDLSCAENIDRLFDRARDVLGRIDIFIANAGFAYFEQVTNPDWAHIEKIYRVNVFSSIYSLEKMETLCGDHPYKMVITASAMAHIAVPGYALYSSTKAALDRFADGYRWQMKDPRRLMLVYPISTRTGFFLAAGKNVPTPWPNQSPGQVAKAILDGIQKDRQRVYPSLTFRFILFLKRFLPAHRLVQSIEQKRMDGWLARSDHTE